MESVSTSEVPCGKYALDARYMTKVPDHAQYEEIFVLCPFSNLPRPCDMKTRFDGRPCQDRGHKQFGGAKKCETSAHNIGAYKIL